ncbi:MAG: cold-shock protein [Lachnospiraceae bacterium]|nr:cold-shock protein [Lachnospiraceae bacterium]
MKYGKRFGFILNDHTVKNVFVHFLAIISKELKIFEGGEKFDTEGFPSRIKKLQAVNVCVV